MYYKDILSQAARRLGYSSYADINKDDLFHSLRFAEEDILQETNVSRSTHFLHIHNDITEYPLPINFGRPYEYLILNQDGAALEHVELTYENFMRWNPGVVDGKTENELLDDKQFFGNLQDKARLYGKLGTVIRYDSKSNRYKFFIKPTISGRVELYYSPTLPTDILDGEFLELQSRIPEEFRRHIIPGVVMYLAEIEEGKALSRNEPQRVEALHLIKRSARAEFQNRNLKVKQQSTKSTQAKRIKPDMWYDNPRKYR